MTFGSAYSQNGFDDLNKIFDEHEKKYQEKNSPYAESQNDTKRIRQIKQTLNTRRQKQIEVNNLAEKQKDESNQYQNIENNATKKAANSISGKVKAPTDLSDAINMVGRTDEEKAYDNAVSSTGISNANDAAIITGNHDIPTTENEANEISKDIILAFSIVGLLLFLIIIRRKRIKISR